MTSTTTTTMMLEPQRQLGKKAARVGDIVTIDLQLTPERGYIPEPLFDTQGRISFVLGWGNYLPGLHELVQGRSVGDVVEHVSIDAGWGDWRSDMVFEVPLTQLERIVGSNSRRIRVGAALTLQGGIDVTVTEIRTNDDHNNKPTTMVVIDANPPLAGSSFACSLEVLEIHTPAERLFEYQDSNDVPDSLSSSSRFRVATFALGCFWGAELAFSRSHGVVGTKVGYSQGVTSAPTYEEVCQGSTQHREAVMVVYDTTVVSYADLLVVAHERIAQTTSTFELSKFFEHRDDEMESVQYKHGFYFHNDAQQQQALAFINNPDNKCRGVELLRASQFYDAEDFHQHYLFKGGQSSKKGAKETIRCYG